MDIVISNKNTSLKLKERKHNKEWSIDKEQAIISLKTNLAQQGIRCIVTLREDKLIGKQMMLS